MNTQLFHNPKELLDYIPKCIICGKEMMLTIGASLRSVPPAKNYRYNEERMNAPTELKEGLLLSKNRKFPFSIEIESGKLPTGKELFERMHNDYAHFTKSCRTCDFKIYSSVATPRKDHFPILALKSERLHYTMRGGKEVELNRSYQSVSTEPVLTSIRINHKWMPSMPGLEFSKFSDLSHLNQRLSTIIVFG